jgi:hypothetical protein
MRDQEQAITTFRIGAILILGFLMGSLLMLGLLVASAFSEPLPFRTDQYIPPAVAAPQTPCYQPK